MVRIRQPGPAWLGVAFIGVLGLSPPSTAGAADPTVDFNRDIRPILSDVCFQCHGPDQAKRKAKQSLKTEDGSRGKAAAAAASALAAAGGAIWFWRRRSGGDETEK